MRDFICVQFTIIAGVKLQHYCYVTCFSTFSITCPHLICNNTHKKLLYSDWLIAVQFKCNTSAKSETPVQITSHNRDYDCLKDNWKIFRPIISCKAMTKNLDRNSEKSFLECAKMASINILRHFLQANVFMFVLLIRNHMVYLVQFGINLHLWLCNFTFLKNSLVQINSKLNLKLYDYLF